MTEVGGTKVQNIELPENDFGRNFTVDYNRLLVPESEKDYCDVVKNAYVKIKKQGTTCRTNTKNN